MATVDVTVRGAGVFGLSVAWACLKAGATVRVIDPNGVASGASGGIVGALAPHVPEQWNPKKAFQLESLLMAEEWWAEVAEKGGKNPGYARSRTSLRGNGGGDFGARWADVYVWSG